MPYTLCPYCNKKSYSAAELRTWICPYCNKTVKKEEGNREIVKSEQAK
ncbi:hypothetical protein [Tepidanaerobacter syntrophicus]|nr:hypothetical protein [Tepidanaerobacter syntrophicus]HHV82946.1 hypothetical protein [Tepidanaerobacter syntrophicus]